MRRFGMGILLFLFSAFVVGCGNNDQTGEVSGTITYEGKAIENGAITFFPSNGPTAGSVIKDGTYSAKVPVGKTKVVISGSKVVGSKKVYDTPDSPVMPVTAEMLPAKYNTASELRHEVESGKHTKDFTLTK